MSYQSISQTPSWKIKAQIAGLLAVVLVLVFSISYASNKIKKDRQMLVQADIRGQVRAPELDGGLGWLNTDKPVRLADLRGKIVLLDFWTYCCINCIHVIPDLKKLEKKYPNELVVIGVHSAKFVNERDTANIRQAILRYEIEHPVVNDAEFKIWNQYGARGWPHLTLIDPEGYVVGSLSGEGNYATLDRSIQQLIGKFKTKINYVPLSLALEKDKEPATLLSYPGKVLADRDSNRLFVSDSNHNRILISDLSGKVLDIAGSGGIGNDDGPFDTAQFDHPQGMALDGQFLYVADTENHLLRKLDLQKRTVTSIAGTGTQARGRSAGGSALRTDLNSPWDLEFAGDDPEIYIAMAGPHQLWVYNPTGRTVKPYAGTGRENITDGPIRKADLAQPSGLTADGTNLYFADSEVSALRWVDRSLRFEQVKTFIGTGLFDFGDRDGAFSQALLQHPLGVQYDNSIIYIADTYNHKIKAANIQTQSIQTLAGNGKPGIGTPTKAQFNEPGGLSIAGKNLYIADTNNHSIRVMNLDNGRVETLSFDLSEWNMKKSSEKFDVFGDPQKIQLLDKKIPDSGSFQVTFQFPLDHHFNPAIQPIVQYKVSASGKEWVGPKFHPQVNKNVMQFDLKRGPVNKPETVDISILYYYCRDDNQGQCWIGSLLISGQAQPGSGRTAIECSVEY